MTDVNPASAGSEEEPAEADAPIIRDRRRIDPETGDVRDPGAAQADSPASGGAGEASQRAPEAAAEPDQPVEAPAETSPETEQPSAEDVAAGLQDQLLREKAAFHNYRELMKRERPKDRENAIGSVVEALLPVLDDVHYARAHGELDGTPFAKIADKLEATLGRYGVESFGAEGEPFDPALHEALMHVEAEVPDGATDTTIVQVMQPGFRIGDRVVRPARVSVADPA